MGDRQLEQAIFDTIRYFDLFKTPLTTTQIWRSLIIDREGTDMRWHGRHVPSLATLKEAIGQSTWLQQQLIMFWGYYCLRQSAPDKTAAKLYIQQYLYRHALAQQKWKITRKIARFLAPLPLIRMIGVTGSLAMFNTQPGSDLDLFIIAKQGRVWLVRLLLIIVTELKGRRRRYWHEQAPDKVCLNHYISDSHLTMSPAVQNIYTAVSYHQLVLLSGHESYQQWQQANETWLKRWLMYPAVISLPSRLSIPVGHTLSSIRTLVESLLLELPGDYLERLSEKIQRYFIAKHSYHHRGRVNLSKFELAFHPDTKVPDIIKKFQEEAGQGQLL